MTPRHRRSMILNRRMLERESLTIDKSKLILVRTTLLPLQPPILVRTKQHPPPRG